MAAITDFTAGRILDSISTLWASEASVQQIVAPNHIITVDQVNRAGSVITDFVPMGDGSVTALTANTGETASGTQSVIPVSFTMAEYGKGSDAVKFPWKEFEVKNANPDAYVKLVEVMANKAISAGDLLGTAHVRDNIGGGTNAAYVHPLGPDDTGSGVMGFSSPTASKLVRYGTASTTRANRAAIQTSDLATWDWVSSAVGVLGDRKVRPLAIINGRKIFGVIAHRHLLKDLLKSLTSTSVYDNLLSQADVARNLASFGLASGLNGLYDGVLLIESSRMKYAAAGLGSIDVYPMAVVGGDFLAKAALSPSAMPRVDGNGEVIQVGDGCCVIAQQDFGQIHGTRMGIMGWYGYLGHGVLDPYSCIRIECASTSASRI